MFIKLSQQDLLVVGYRYERESGVKDAANGFSKTGLPVRELYQLRPHQETEPL